MTNRPTLTNERFWNLTDAELRYVAQDAKAAELAVRSFDPVNAARYCEQVCDAATVLASRKVVS